MDSLLNILVQMIAGGFTGYITNTYAIDMLFREYKIYKNIKIGGVIKKTRNEFIENISVLVEKDIINYETIGNEFHKKEFTESIEKLIYDFLHSSLAENLEQKSFQDLKESGGTIEGISVFFEKILKERTEKAVELVFQNTQISDLLSREQIAYSINKVLEECIAGLEEMEFTEGYFVSLLEDSGDLVLKDILPGSEAKVREDLLRELEEGIIHLQKNGRKEIRTLLDSIFSSLDYERAIRAFQDQLYQKTIFQIVAPANRDAVFEEMRSNIIIFLQSDPGKEILERIVKEVFLRLKEAEKSVFDLINPEFQPAAEEYLNRNLPLFIAEIASWIQKNAAQIELLIQEAVDETIAGTEGMRNLVLGIIRGTVLDDLAGKNRLVSRIVEYLQEKIDIAQLSSDLSLETMEFLKRKKIGDIIIGLENHNLINYQSIAELLAQGMINILNNREAKDFQEFFETKAGDIIKTDLSGLFNEKLKNKLIDKLTDYLCSAEILGETVKKHFADRYDMILGSSLKELLTEENRKYLAALINRKSAEKFSDNGNFAAFFTESIKFDSFLKEVVDNEQQEKICNAVTVLGGNKFSSVLQENKNKPLVSYLHKLNEVPDIQNILAENLLTLLQENLPQFLEGKIEFMVRENLSKLSEDQICELVHDFMGRELLPITRFGAVLGGLAGILLALAGEGTALLSSEISLSGVITYGFVGLLTNVIALEMIFRPYKKSRILSSVGLEVFSQGYILKNKDKFALNMGLFVDESLLERNNISLRFAEHRTELEQEIRKALSADQYEVILSTLDLYSARISEKAGSLLKERIEKEKISENLIKKTESLVVGDILEDKQIMAAVKSAIDSLAGQNKKMVEDLLLLISMDRSLGNLWGEDTRVMLKSYLEKEIAAFSGILAKKISDKEELYTKALQRREQFLKLISRDIVDLAGIEAVEAIKDNAVSAIHERLFSPQIKEKIHDLVREKLDQEMEPELEIADLFGGRLRKFADDNTEKILNKFKDYLAGMIKNSQKTIQEQVKSRIQENLGFFQKGVYMIMSGDLIVDEIISRLVNQKIPDYLETSKSEIRMIIVSFLENNIYPTKLRDLQLSLKENQAGELLEEFLSSKENIELIELETGEIIRGIVDGLVRISLGNYLKIVELNYIGGVLERFDKEISVFLETLSEVLDSDKEKIAAHSAVHGMAILEIVLGKMRTGNILRKVSRDDISELVDRGLEIFLLGPSVRLYTEKFLLQLYSQRLKGKNLKEILNKELLAEDIGKTLSQIFSIRETEEFFAETVYRIIQEVKENRLDFIHKETADELLQIFVSAVLDALGSNLAEILKVIDFRTITEREINKMDAREIHSLFKSFAGGYFTRLKLWGLLGAVFGIHGGIGLLAALGYAVKERGAKN